MLYGRELGKAAYEAWGRYGVPVFPCGDDKRPLLKWKEGAQTDEQAICDLFESFGSRARLIGAKTGEEANLFVLDFDLYKGPHVKEYLQTLMMGNLLPPTLVHETRSGGLHYFYMTDKPSDMLRNSVPTDGVEVRGEGGFVIVPPSHGYKVLEDNPVEYAPENLLRRLERADRAFKSLTPSQLKEQIIEGKSFHEPLTALAAKLNAQGLPPADVMKELAGAMEASVASSSAHERHGRWASIMKGGDGELARIASSGYRKFNPRKSEDDVRQVVGKMAAMTRNRDVTLGGFFAKPPTDDDDPKKGAFGEKAKEQKATESGDDFPFKRAYTAAKVDDEDNKRFLIYPLIMESDTIVLSAAPKAGKTLTTMNLCLHAAAGIPIGDDLVPMNKEGKTDKLPVVYFALEGQGAIRKRVKGWVMEQRKKGHKITEDSLRLYVVEQSVNLAEDEAKQDTVDKLLAANAFFQKKGWGELAIVVFDTLTKAMPGKDQNSVEDTSAVFNTVDMMREVGLNAAVIFVHHNNRSGSGPRGSGNIAAEPDTVLSVNKVDPVLKDGVQVDCYKLSVYMARAIDDAQTYTFAAESIEIGINTQGIMERAPVLGILDNYEAVPTKATTTIKAAAEGARAAFYDQLWQTLSDRDEGSMSFSDLHRKFIKGDPQAAAFYNSHMNAKNKTAAKAAWTALLHPQRLPTTLQGMGFQVGEEGVTMTLDLKKGAAG